MVMATIALGMLIKCSGAHPLAPAVVKEEISRRQLQHAPAGGLPKAVLQNRNISTRPLTTQAFCDEVFRPNIGFKLRDLSQFFET
jgi:hypothetical protein